MTKKTLYRASVRDSRVTAAYVRAMSTRMGKRAEFATLADPFERIIMVDRRVAFISNHLVAGAPAHAAWQVTDPAVIAYMVAEFEEKLRRADPWHGELGQRGQRQMVDTVSGPAPGVRTTPRQREVLRDMVAGKDRRATAGRLGVSERTVSVEITALMDVFDASSREQLAFKWAFSPDRLVDDEAPTTSAAGAEDDVAA